MDGQDKTIERRVTERPTAEAILAAACRVIVRRGVERTRIVDIAREAGTSTGTVHYYFETKDEVLLAALEWANDQPYGRVDDLLGREANDLSRLGKLLELSIPYPGPQREE
jgi:AcrR family transcriptional regulator